MSEFSIDYKPPRLNLKYSGMEVGLGHRNQIILRLDRLCIDLEHIGISFF